MMGAVNKGRAAALLRIPKNNILDDRVNDQQTKLAKAAPKMVRNPRKQAKTGAPTPSILGD